jgi:hypothetical protein
MAIPATKEELEAVIRAFGKEPRFYINTIDEWSGVDSKVWASIGSGNTNTISYTSDFGQNPETVEKQAKENVELREQADLLEMTVLRRGQIIADLSVVGQKLAAILRDNELTPPQDVVDDIAMAQWELAHEEELIAMHAEDQTCISKAIREIRVLASRTRVTREDILQIKKIATEAFINLP